MNYTILKQASTKAPTELTGSNTLYFSDTIFAFNNYIGVSMDNPFQISGSVIADKFIQLLSKIDAPVLSDTQNDIVIKYGKNSAKLRKEVSGLAMYKTMVFPKDIPESKEIPTHFFDALSIGKFQNHKARLSGVFFDDDIVYMVNPFDVAYYTIEPMGVSFWIPKEAVDIILNYKDQITQYSLTDSFIYLYTNEFTLAIKLKLNTQYPIDAVEKLINSKRDFSTCIEIDGILETLNRIKICTISDANQKQVFKMEFTNGSSVKVSSMGTADLIEEQLDTFCPVDVSMIVPVDTFISLYKEHMNMYLMKDKDGIFLASHDDDCTYMMNVHEDI
jgi:hypothetical protein